ncbi:type IV toxin-antitoxin system AbiEi family antitoxin [Leifsonia sp. McL0607]|uniref:type IV toxin-antitoxin system AbiEi family antitoxin n=1 Tax=Leifsonia sp. McL0607 TaxID=3415672 RepID=UPI003CF45C6D
MTTACPLLFDRSVLPLAELFALVLDGQLYRVGDAFATPDTPDTPELRAHAFGALRPGRLVADRGTAAWIHGTRSTPPLLPQVCIDRESRGRVPTGFDAHQHALLHGDTIELGGVRLTEPLRTALDLVLTSPTFDPANALEVRHLLAIARASPGELRDRLARSRRRGSARAVMRLALVERTQLPGAPEALERRLSRR